MLVPFLFSLSATPTSSLYPAGQVGTCCFVFLRLRALSNTTIRLCRILLSGFVEYCDRLSLIVPPKCPSLLAKQEAYCLWQLSPSGERVRGCCRGPRDIGSPVIKIAWFCQAQ